MSSCFRDIGLWSYCGHEFDLSGSRDVIAWSHDLDSP